MKVIEDLPFSSLKLENKNILQNYENIVLVDWIKSANSEEEGYWEKGLQSLPNTLYQLSNDYTYKKVLEHFEIKKKITNTNYIFVKANFYYEVDFLFIDLFSISLR